MMSFPLFLADCSQKRLIILKQIGIEPKHLEPGAIEKTPLRKESAYRYAERVARLKAESVFLRPDMGKNVAVLAIETVISCGCRMLREVEDREDALRCLELLSGRRHRVYGGVCIYTSQRVFMRVVRSDVKLKRLSAEEMKRYVYLGQEWCGCPGGYTVAGYGAVFVRWIQGSYSNMMGVPLYEVSTLLEGIGWTSSSNTR